MKVARKSLAMESGDTYKKRSKLSLFSPRDFQESQQATKNSALS
jgi:FtsZ-interacting cell division protein YlmF